MLNEELLELKPQIHFFIFSFTIYNCSMMVMVVVMMQCVDAHIYAQGEEQYRADHAEPLLEGVQAVSQISDAHSAVRD